MSQFTAWFATASSKITEGVNAACGDSCNKGLTVNSLFANIANILVFIVGAVSVIMIIVGGLKYVISNGDAKNTESAKNTILYAVVGLVVAIAAFAIVNFVTAHI